MNNNLVFPSTTNKNDNYAHYIVFNLNNIQYAINLKTVIEVTNIQNIEIPQITPVGIIGICNYKGIMVKVVDLCPILGFETNKISINDQLIVVNVEGIYFTIHSESITNVVQIEKHNIQELPYSTDKSIVKAIYKEGNESINILDTKKILNLLNQNKQGTIDYTTLLPKDDKSKKILAIRSQQNEKKKELFSFPVNIKDINQYILFELNKQNYYLDIKYIKEFISLKRLNITKLPYTKNYIKGIINLKGDFLVVVDLKKFLNPNTTDNTQGTKLIIVESKNFNIALLVDEIKYIKNIEKMTNTNNSNSPYISSEFMEEGVLYNILNFEKIINDERLFINIK